MELSKEMLVDIIINIINIVVLFLVVRKLAYKPVKKFMEARTAKIMQEKEEAQRLSEEAQAKVREYDRCIAESNAAKEQAFKQGEAEGKAEANRLVEEAREKSNQILAQANQKAEEKCNKMLKNAEQEIASIAIDVSEKLLAREITDKDNQKIVADFLADRGQVTDNA